MQFIFDTRNNGGGGGGGDGVTNVGTGNGLTGGPITTTIDMSQLTVAGQQLQAMYSGGTIDYSTGSLTFTIQYARIV